MSKHTPAPWSSEGNTIHRDYGHYKSYIGSMNGRETLAPEEAANAARIVECVNAMEGIAHPDIYRAKINSLVANIEHPELDHTDKLHFIDKVLEAVGQQSLGNVKHATAHRDACFEWEKTMGELTGCDSPSSVEKYVNKLKSDLETNERFYKTASQSLEQITLLVEGVNNERKLMLSKMRDYRNVLGSLHKAVSELKLGKTTDDMDKAMAAAFKLLGETI